MIKSSVFHKIGFDYSYMSGEKMVTIKIKTAKDDVTNINLYYLDKYRYMSNKKVHKDKMKKIASTSIFDYYEVTINVDMLCVCYFFEIINDEETVYYANNKFSETMPDGPDKVFMMPVLSENQAFKIPNWAKNAIVYQIFPDRFFNGNPKNSPPKIEKWENEVIKYNSFFGGDLSGIIQKLDYIKELGVNAIYLTPVFASNTNHKYNIFDYYKIDPYFGTNDELKELVNKAHSLGIRVILDAVFNHCGTEFFAFKDVVTNGENSQYKNWFDIRKYPVEAQYTFFKDESQTQYSTFGYFGGLPKLMTQNLEVQKYFIDAAVYWIKEADIDGWRLDVADEVDPSFWREFRKAVKQEKEDALIIGEVWYDSSSWLQGDQFDTVMNYVFQKSVIQYIALKQISPEEFGYNLEELRGIYKQQPYSSLWNLIDSHDTARFLTVADCDIDSLKLAAFMQMTFTGIPMIYYGDEVGMQGGPDPDCRRGMLWGERQNKELLEYYKQLIKIRKENIELTKGDFKTICADNENWIYGFEREYMDKSIKVYINNGDKNYDIELTWENGSIVQELISGKILEVTENKIKIEIPAKSGIIISYKE